MLALDLAKEAEVSVRDYNVLARCHAHRSNLVEALRSFESREDRVGTGWVLLVVGCYDIVVEAVEVDFADLLDQL